MLLLNIGMSLSPPAAVYMVVADIALGRSLPYAFLDRIQAEFQEKYAEKAENAVAHSLDKSFG